MEEKSTMIVPHSPLIPAWVRRWMDDVEWQTCFAMVQRCGFWKCEEEEREQDCERLRQKKLQGLQQKEPIDDSKNKQENTRPPDEQHEENKQNQDDQNFLDQLQTLCQGTFTHALNMMKTILCNIGMLKASSNTRHSGSPQVNFQHADEIRAWIQDSVRTCAEQTCKELNLDSAQKDPVTTNIHSNRHCAGCLWIYNPKFLGSNPHKHKSPCNISELAQMGCQTLIMGLLDKNYFMFHRHAQIVKSVPILQYELLLEGLQPLLRFKTTFLTRLRFDICQSQPDPHRLRRTILQSFQHTLSMSLRSQVFCFLPHSSSLRRLSIWMPKTDSSRGFRNYFGIIQALQQMLAQRTFLHEINLYRLVFGTHNIPFVPQLKHNHLFRLLGDVTENCSLQSGCGTTYDAEINEFHLLFQGKTLRSLDLSNILLTDTSKMEFLEGLRLWLHNHQTNHSLILTLDPDNEFSPHAKKQLCIVLRDAPRLVSLSLSDMNPVSNALWASGGFLQLKELKTIIRDDGELSLFLSSQILSRLTTLGIACISSVHSVRLGEAIRSSRQLKELILHNSYDELPDVPIKCTTDPVSHTCGCWSFLKTLWSDLSSTTILTKDRINIPFVPERIHLSHLLGCTCENHECTCLFSAALGFVQALDSCPLSLVPAGWISESTWSKLGIPRFSSQNLQFRDDRPSYSATQRKLVWETALRVYQKQQMAQVKHKHWATLAFFIAFVRANAGHRFCLSGLTLAPLAMKMLSVN